MDYQVFNLSSGEEEQGTVAHVFARAYRESWLALHAEELSGRHWFERLGIAIDFSPSAISGADYPG